MLLTKYNYFYHYYFNGVRYCFYANLFRRHPEVKYAIFSDDDTLLFKDPFTLLQKQPDVIHAMYDDGTYKHHSGPNFRWVNVWAKYIPDYKKDKCNIWKLNKSLYSKELDDLYYFNCGLMIGKAEYLLKVSELMCHSFTCPGMFIENAEQGLLNYLNITGQIGSLGVKIVGYTIYDKVLISCPDHLDSKEYIETLNASSLIAVHHYHRLYKERFVKIASKKISDIMFGFKYAFRKQRGVTEFS